MINIRALLRGLFRSAFSKACDEEITDPQPIKLFVSHSTADAPLAEALVELFRSALNLPAKAIRCTSVEGYRLPGGANVDEQLRSEVNSAKACVGIISRQSIQSPYVLLELGARWGPKLHLLPVLAPGNGPEVPGWASLGVARAYGRPEEPPPACRGPRKNTRPRPDDRNNLPGAD